jgi:hypothetical protein
LQLRSTLERHFPESLHQDILNAVGLTLETAARQKRDPQSRQRVLTGYAYHCAVCGFDVRLGPVPIALGAAHIRRHQGGGPDRESNGLALCVPHHKTFDLGAFTVSPGGVLLVSDQAHGGAGFEMVLLPHHGKGSGKPSAPNGRPSRTSSIGTAGKSSRGRPGIRTVKAWRRGVTTNGNDSGRLRLGDQVEAPRRSFSISLCNLQAQLGTIWGRGTACLARAPPTGA